MITQAALPCRHGSANQSQRLQLFAVTHSLSSPLLEEVFESLQFVFRELQFICHSVYENAEEDQCRHRTLLLVDCHRHTKPVAGVLHNSHCPSTLIRIWGSNNDIVIQIVQDILDPALLEAPTQGISHRIGADRRPKGRQESTYTFPSHSMP